MAKNMTPCIVGVSQQTWRPEQTEAPHPLQQAVEVSLSAAADCTNKSILQHIDGLSLVLPISWSYDEPSSQLASMLSLKPGSRKLSGLSGTSPQKFINEAAEEILKGEKQAVLVCGAEAFATRKIAKIQQRILDWPKPQLKAKPSFEDPLLSTEISHEIFQAYTTFAILDSARRAHLKYDLSDYRYVESQMMSRLSLVAANNPNAWFQKSYTTEELFNTSKDNRMVAYPYSKNTMAYMDVDMAAAILIVNDSLADELDIPMEKRVYLHGWDYAKDLPYIAQREALWRCPAMERSSRSALEMANTKIDEISHFDLYSCFPGSLNFTKDALGINDDDARPLTVTGGLPYFGGPGNNYTSHSVTSMIERLRKEPGDFGLISGVGMHMTNHVFAIYNSTKPQQLKLPDMETNNEIGRIIKDEVNGPAVISGYTVVHSRDGSSAFAVCELEDGNRCYARSFNEDILKNMEEEEWVGKIVHLSCSKNKVNIF